MLSIPNLKVLVEGVLALLIKKQNFKNQSLNLELSKRGASKLQNFVDIMIEAIYQSESIIRILSLNLFGRFQLSHLTIIIIFQYSLMELEKNSIHIVLLRFWELTTFSRREEIKFYQ